MQKLVFITGCPRTGTHLANALVAGSPLVQPILTEAIGHVFPFLDARKAASVQVKSYPDTFFSTQDEADALIASYLDAFVSHLRTRFSRPIVILRGPGFAARMTELLPILVHSKEDWRIISLSRDPRDLLVSFKVWHEKLIAQRGTGLLGGPMPYLKERLKVSYNWLNKAPKDRLLSFRYEDLVQQPNTFIKAAADLLSIPSDGMGNEGWNNSCARISADHPILGAAVTTLYNKAPSDASIGTYKTLSKEEIEELSS